MSIKSAELDARYNAMKVGRLKNAVRSNRVTLEANFYVMR